MNSVSFVVHFLFLYSIVFGLAYGKTSTSLGVRFSDACKGFVSLNDTIQCSYMCQYIHDKENNIDPKIRGVQIDTTDTQCTQIKVENNQVMCFETDITTDDQITLVEQNQISSAKTHLYIGAYNNTHLRFVPIEGAESGAPEFSLSAFPFEIWGWSKPVVINRGLMICREFDTQCSHWKFSSDSWTPMPTPTEQHGTSPFGFLDGRLVLAGGMGLVINPTEKTEIFDPTTQIWSDGPPLIPPRSHYSLVQVNPDTIIVIGGYAGVPVAYTNLLSVGDSQWTELDNRPQNAYYVSCGVVELSDKRRGALTIGGNDGASLISSAYFLDFASLKWTRIPEFDAPYPSAVGSLFQWNLEVHFIPGERPTGVLESHHIKKIENATLLWEQRPSPIQNSGLVVFLPILDVMVFNMTLK